MTTINHSDNNDNLYDRQNRTYGIEATKLIQSSCVYIIGLKNGYASEICKNLALSGIKKLILFGDEVIDEEDKKNCMFYRKSTIGSLCWEEIKRYINEINNSVNVEHTNIIKQPIIPCVFTCVIINKSFDEAQSINNRVRLLNGKTIYMVASGLAGSIFVDANVNHQVFDTTGEIKEDTPIKDIIGNKIICGKHNFTFGDKVKFINMVGDNLDYYNNNIFRVCNSNNNSIEIIEEDYKAIEQSDKIMFINGTIKYVPTMKTFNHFEMNYNDSSDIYKNLNSMLISNDCDDIKIKNSFKYTFQPTISIMGGFVSSEVIKLLTNKYTPIDQWFDWSDFNINVEDIDNINEHLNKNIVMIGCGALGCEWLKNLTMMGFKNIKIIDPDHI
jgi:molybdopterin/thiamine biosynthesis adenylyltransferase